MKKGVIVLIVVFILLLSANHLLAAPGDSSDPIITLSYIESVLIPNIKQLITDNTPTYKVINVENGKSVICEAGTELILRMGSATAIAPAKGGLADVTHGVDLSNLVAIPSNSNLIVPLSDGRGIKATSDIIIMIKGSYKIQ